jgi:hypothetical protein
LFLVGVLSMKNSVKLAVAVLAMMAPSFAHATIHEILFDFTSSSDSVSASGKFAFSASNEITSISGTVSNTALGGNITGIVANGQFPNASLSPDNLFIYDNRYTPGNPVFNTNGVLFTTSNNLGGYWNLWGTGAGSYTLYASSPAGGYPVQEFGTMSVTGVPETSTWVMMMAGFGALGFAGYRRTRNERVTFGA